MGTLLHGEAQKEEVWMKKTCLILLLAALILLSPVKGMVAGEPLSATLMLDKETVDIAKGESITATWTAQGGTPPYYVSYDWLIKDGPYYDGYAGGSGSHTINPKHGSSGTFYLGVTDDLGDEVEQEASFVLVGAPEIQPLSVSISLDKAMVDVAKGESIIVTWNIEGGLPPYGGWAKWIVKDSDVKEPVWTKLIEVSASGSDTITPAFGDAGSIWIEIWDSGSGMRFEDETEFTITNAPPASPLTADVIGNKDRVDITQNETITYTWKVTGGTPPYSLKYRWKINELGHELGSGMDYCLFRQGSLDGLKSFDIIPQFGVAGEFWIDVTDRTGKTCSEYDWYDSYPDAYIMGEQGLKLNKSVAAVGETLIAMCTPVGGEAPFTYEYTWYVSDGGERKMLRKETTASNTDSFVLPVGKTGSVFVQVTDSKGRSGYTTRRGFTITAPPLTGDADGNGSIDLNDLTHMINHIIGKVRVTSLSNADSNGNGEVDLHDLLYVISAIVGG
jgi:hypothetical protein